MFQPTAQGCYHAAYRPNSTLIVALTDRSDGFILEINLILSKVYSLAAAQPGSIEVCLWEAGLTRALGEPPGFLS